MHKNKKGIKRLFACSKPWHLKWWLWLFGLIFILVIPFVINESYKFGNSTENGYVTLWGAKDALGFYGSFLSFIGTVALGTLALYQNKIFKEENEKTNRKLMQAQIFSSCAFYKIRSCKITIYEGENVFRIIVYLQNIGKSVAVCTLLYEFEFSRYGYKCGKHADDIFLQINDMVHSNVRSDGIIDFYSESIPLKITEGHNTFYAHITLSIVSENQFQYDQVIQLKFEKQDGKLKYVSEYPAQFLKLHEIKEKKTNG